MRLVGANPVAISRPFQRLRFPSLNAWVPHPSVYEAKGTLVYVCIIDGYPSRWDESIDNPSKESNV